MTNHGRDQYDVEQPSENAGDASSGPPPKAPPANSSKPAPIELENDVSGSESASRDVPMSQRSVKELDICPNCGASMRGEDALVCLRCGFDLKTMRVMKTETGEAVVPDAEKPEPLVKPGMGDLWMPGIIAALCGGFIAICYLAGVRGLFPAIDAAILEQQRGPEIGIGDRFQGLLRFVVLVSMWTVCGLGALAFLARLLSVPLVARLSDLKLAAMRMLAIVAAARMAALINFDSTTFEWIVEAALQLAIFIGLSIVLFRLNPRDGATLGSSALILFMLLWGAANAVVWATA